MITVLRITKGKGPFYRVSLSNDEKLRVSEDALVKYRLLKGQELTDSELEEIKENSTYDYGLQQAMNYISYQLRSEKEVRLYLRDKEIEFPDQEKIIRRLKELDLINDQIFGDSYIRTQVRLGDKGPRNLAQQLKQKGLSQEVIDRSLLFYSQEDQLDIAVHTAEKVIRKTHGKSFKELKIKVRQTLMQKGFLGDTITQAIDQMEWTEDASAEEEALVLQGEKLWRKNQRFEPAKRRQKVKQSLYQKGFDLDKIQRFIEEKEEQNE